MNKLLTCSVVTAFMVTGAALAQAQEQETQPPSSTSKEGKASERVTPGKTPTQGAVEEATANPAPSTSATEGTAADRTPAGKTPMSETAARSGTSSKIVGREVVSATDAQLGKVTEVVFDAQGQPDFVVIASQGSSAAVPYATANSMMRGDKIVMDQSRLAKAPKVKPGEWRSSSSSSWKSDSQRYWNKG